LLFSISNFEKLKRLEVKFLNIYNLINSKKLTKEELEKNFKSIKYQLKDINVYFFQFRSLLLKKELESKYFYLIKIKNKIDLYLKQNKDIDFSILDKSDLNKIK
jgi:hypothetical protein